MKLTNSNLTLYASTSKCNIAIAIVTVAHNTAIKLINTLYHAKEKHRDDQRRSLRSVQ